MRTLILLVVLTISFCIEADEPQLTHIIGTDGPSQLTNGGIDGDMANIIDSATIYKGNDMH